VARYNNSTTSAVAFPAYRNEANLAPGSGCCHFCTLDYKRAQSGRRKKRRGKRVLRGMGCGGMAAAGAAVGWRWRGEEWSACGRGGVQGKPAIGLFWDAFLAAVHCILNPRLPVVVMRRGRNRHFGLWTRKEGGKRTQKQKQTTVKQ
jgi:hypothetical protein